MKSQPKPQDKNPTGIMIWRRYVDMFGDVRLLPEASLVLSRDKGNSRRSHYALICRSDTSLSIGDFGIFDHRSYRNVGENGARVGPSQVTSLLQRVEVERDGSGYKANMIAELAGSYWVKLIDPVAVSGSRQRDLIRDLNRFDIDIDDWTASVKRLRRTDEMSYDTNSGWQLPFADF